MARPRKPVSAAALPLELRLRYTLTAGALRPYFEALQRGQALASRCPQCRRTWFPPRLLCPYDRRGTEWIALNGRGRIVNVTSGVSRLPLAQTSAHHCFALIALEGADNVGLARVIGDVATLLPGTHVRLIASPEAAPHPAQSACFIADD